MQNKTKIPPTLETSNGLNTSNVINNDGVSQSSTYNGRRVSGDFSVIVPPNLVPKSPNESAVASHTSGLSLTSVSQINSNFNDRIELGKINPISDITPENLKRRDFFLKLRDKFIESLYVQNGMEGCAVTFNKNGYDHDNLRSDCMCYLALLTCCVSVCVAKHHFRNKVAASPSAVPIGLRQFATRISLGLVFQYQDQIPLLNESTCNALMDCFLYAFTHPFIFPGASDSSQTGTSPYDHYTVYNMLMWRSCFINDLFNNDNKRILQNINGTDISICHILSTGLCTVLGGKYHFNQSCKKERSYFNELSRSINFPLYKWGTDYAVTRGPGTSKMFETIESEKGVGDHESIFWDMAEGLTKQYLTETEFSSLYS